MQKIRQQLRFTGQVQGVGFRYTAYHLAVPLGLTGWVRNEPDGSVLMEVQGTEQDIAELTEKLAAGTFIQIDGIARASLPVDDAERRFRITY